jgi:hypothetical protein
MSRCLGKSTFAATALVLFWLIQFQTTTSADTAPSVPKLVAAQATVRMDIEKPGLFDTSETRGTANGDLLITNQGTSAATGLSVSGVFRDGTSVDLTATTPEGEAVTDLAVNGDLVIGVSFAWTADNSDSGTFVVKDGNASGPPLTIPFIVREIVPGSVFGWAALLAAVAAVVLSLVTYASLKLPPPDQQNRRRPPLSRVVYPVGSWTFSGSWASSLTAVGAILGTVIAASGFLSDVLPGLAIGLFAGVFIGYGLVAALAGVVYVASHNATGKPTYLALMLAAGVTLWAVVGELFTLALLVARGGLPQPWIWFAALVVLTTLLLYDRRSILQVLLAPEKPPPSPPAAGGGVDAVAEVAAAALVTASEAMLARAQGPSALL